MHLPNADVIISVVFKLLLVSVILVSIFSARKTVQGLPSFNYLKRGIVPFGVMCKVLYVFFSLRMHSPDATDKAATKMDGGGECSMMKYEQFLSLRYQGETHSYLFLWVALHSCRTPFPDEPVAATELIPYGLGQHWQSLCTHAFLHGEESKASGLKEPVIVLNRDSRNSCVSFSCAGTSVLLPWGGNTDWHPQRGCRPT